MESRKLTERLINYVMFKVVFVGAVVEPDLLEILLWTVWFTALGFLKLFGGLVRDRCEWLASAPVAVPAGHARALTLLTLLVVGVVGWATAYQWLFQHAGISEHLLLMFEVALIAVDLAQTVLRYSFHLWDAFRRAVDDRLPAGASLEVCVCVCVCVCS